MANHKSAEKRARQTIKKTEVNRTRKARVKTLSKKVDVAVASQDKEASIAALKVAAKALQRTATKGTMTKKTVARRISKLAKKVNTVSK